ncbi:MAG: polyketide beta-ketoacyl:ACP synthase [Lysobacteraceae bacterium]|nr:MAG: polyketide beta-ketoacyl:ACP synthase [Xanthomonadaceae bacterium]
MRLELAATGIGVIAAIGQGKARFAEAMLRGDAVFGVMRRDGRQSRSAFLGAEINDIAIPADITPQMRRAASLSALAALTVLHEAWTEARLSDYDPSRVGLIVGGSNLQQRETALLHEAYREREAFLRPTYALSFMDTDLCGFCTSAFGIRGPAWTIGGASASGQLAIVKAAEAIESGRVDACIALGALMDLSHWECRAFRSLGAMGSDRFADAPMLACRPFDQEHDGFIYGESSAAVVIERADRARERGARPYGFLDGWGVVMDANRNPDPSFEGESNAIVQAISRAGWVADQIDYVNPHGTGSIIGDLTELQALRMCGLESAWINATKSLIGHGLSAAGTVEVASTLLQMAAGRLHPTRNLDAPIDGDMRWVTENGVEHHIGRALTLSMGFGGMNTALCWRSAC